VTGTLSKIRLLLTPAERRNALVLLGLMVVGMTLETLDTRHQLEKPGNTPLQLIEVQSGDYLGEDDIVRFDDQYGRLWR